LNLPRVLLFLKESVISSKKEAAEWALQVLPDSFQLVVVQCLAKYENRLDHLTLDEDTLFTYAEYMLKEIKSKVNR